MLLPLLRSVPAAHQLGRQRRWPSVVLWVALALGVPGVLAGPARAEDNVAAVEKVTHLNKRALDAYNNLEFEDARKLLKQALELCSASGLDKHPIKARTHIHMGVVLIASKQQELGIKQFRRALEIQPDIQVTRSLANPEILQAFAEASAGVGGAREPRGGPEGRPGAQPAAGSADGERSSGGEKEGGEPGNGVHHSPVSRGKRGAAITIVATVDKDLPGFAKLVLAYRAEGAAEFVPVDMLLAGGRWAAQIPEDATRGSRVAYFIEAESDDESAIASAATEERPFTIFLGSGRRGGRAEGEAADEGDRDAVPARRFFVALMGGSGIGYTTGSSEVDARDKVTAGFAPSTAAHVLPEVGYFLNASWRLSLQLRYQFVGGTTPLYALKQTPPLTGCGTDNICNPASGAIAVAAHSSWFFGEGALRPYFSLALAGGRIRHVVKFSASPPNCGASGMDVCVYPVTSGPVFAGAGGGLLLALTPIFGLVGEVNALVGFPDFTAHFDVNLGVAARL